MSIKIQSARYGLAERYNDVTAHIQHMVKESNRSITIDNDSMGGDPAHGHRKTLTVGYYGDDGALHITEGAEGSTILLGDETYRLPGSAQWLKD
ncbi:hypothetical protein [Duganella sp. HH101]|uniref:hypothetical protein n=1 Tax=Duganella sp. HH101 TaxID=1781066 RepID=UPI0008744D61|nr:hypothetical protein [Duganella sp. HH101]OFA04411.1 hypothetical protein DUGA2_19560 [Duganella sp. HH101]